MCLFKGKVACPVCPRGSGRESWRPQICNFIWFFSGGRVRVRVGNGKSLSIKKLEMEQRKAGGGCTMSWLASKIQESFTDKGWTSLWSDDLKLLPKVKATDRQGPGTKSIPEESWRMNLVLSPLSPTGKKKNQEQFSFFIGILDLTSSLRSSQYGSDFRCFDKMYDPPWTSLACTSNQIYLSKAKRGGE